MSQLTGNEFQNEKGTQGSLLKWFWSKIYSYFNGVYNDAKAYVDGQLGNVYTKTETDNLLSPITSNVSNLQTALTAEQNARANGDIQLANDINSVLAQVVGLKTITTWDATQPFPATRADGAAFTKGNYVQITVGNGQYKAGDMLICTSDGATSVLGFGDIDNNVDVATDSVFGTVQLIAGLAEYNSAIGGSKVITKTVLQGILGELSDAITTAYQNADSSLQTAITNAYTSAISTALGNYYTKSEVNTLLATKANASDVYTKTATDEKFISKYNYTSTLRERLKVASFVPQLLSSSNFNPTTHKITVPNWASFQIPTAIAHVHVLHASLNGVSIRLFKQDGSMMFPDMTALDGVLNIETGVIDMNPEFGDITGQPFNLVVLGTVADPMDPSAMFFMPG